MRIDGCRSCGSQRLQPALDLGRLPLANALLTEADLQRPEPRFPLELVVCADCSLAQITETVDPERLFRHYLYLSSFADTTLRNARDLARRLTRERRLDASSRVVEVASNDGYLLRHYREAGVPVLGIEPARNVAAAAVADGIPTLCEFFGSEVARAVRSEHGPAGVVHANNVLAHVADPNDFVRGLSELLADDGVAVIEVPHVQELLARLEFDTIYHEHLCYFSLAALERLLRRHGLTVFQVERLPIHGGTLRVFAGSREAPRESVDAVRQAESRAGIHRLDVYRQFAERVRRLREELRSLLGGLKCQGKRLAAYGAAAKGTTLLGYCEIGRETLDYVVDRSTVKQGLYTPGSHLPIMPTEHLLSDRPDYVLLLTWNFAEEIYEQQAAYRGGGGRFVVPLPQPSLT